MIRFFQIIFFTCTVALLTSCGAPGDRPIWEQVKLRDIASSSAEHPTGRLLKTINLDIHIFEMPARKIGTLEDVWQTLYSEPLKFSDYDTFCANSFLIGFGQVPMWSKIVAVLRNVGTKKEETVSLVLPDGQTNDFTIARIDKKQTIFYVSAAGSMEGAAVGPGKLALRVKVEKIPGSRGVCNVSAQPVFTLPVQSSIPQLVAQAKAAEFPFTSVGFSLKMSPGDFILLGPKRYIDGQTTLDSLFFSRPGSIPVVRMFMIVCARIID